MPIGKPPPEFQVGSYVELNAAGKSSGSKPSQLVGIGWPNRFLVSDLIEEEGKTFLCLDPCCGWMLESGKKQELACEGHPAEHFSLLDGTIFGEGAERREDQRSEAAADPKEADGRFTAFNIDGKEVFSVEFGDGEKDRKHSATVKIPGGKTFNLIGREAKFLNDFILSQLNLG